MSDQELETPEKVLNLLTDRMINLNGPTFRKLIRNGYKHPAVIPPPEILQNRPDIYHKYLITVESCQNLFG
ncbi:hypothetical protein C2G38_2162972 [Gigaspora rosea]|uniref:Uncharacterized protein n=1 Tax=Gigaspora rosea TaxID=44941 RepID=A0A397VZY4_9GLOM|nr:hypothetical protein C2G38_2162972 [Gigaspora rosea]